ncbi:MAG: hypothetical protein ACTSW1_16265 [Candidatus Hodarchaeales archaeon]
MSTLSVLNKEDKLNKWNQQILNEEFETIGGIKCSCGLSRDRGWDITPISKINFL